MLTHAQFVQLQMSDPTCLTLPPIVEVPTHGDMAGVALRVIDGDSIEAAYLVRAGTIRVLGIDAPELATPAGKRSRQFAEAIVPLGRVLLMRLQGGDKYNGRVLGDLQLPDGSWFSQEMLQNGYAKSYSGGKRG